MRNTVEFRASEMFLNQLKSEGIWNSYFRISEMCGILVTPLKPLVQYIQECLLPLDTYIRYCNYLCREHLPSNCHEDRHNTNWRATPFPTKNTTSTPHAIHKAIRSQITSRSSDPVLPRPRVSSAATVWDELSHRTMKLCPQAVLVAVASTFAYTVLVLGLKCGSNCSACWKDGDTTGVDTKFSCDRDQCGDACPTGYHDMHCAKSERCL